jgi:hypothetical protein
MATMEGGSRRVIWIIVAVVVVAIAAGAYFLLYGGNSGAGTSGGGAGYFFFAFSMGQARWIGRRLRSIRASTVITDRTEERLPCSSNSEMSIDRQSPRRIRP